MEDLNQEYTKMEIEQKSDSIIKEIDNHLEQIIADIHIRRRAILDIEIEYKRMMECLNELYATVPVAYDKVLEKRYGICNGEKRSIYTEAEIDALLPPALKGQVEN